MLCVCVYIYIYIYTNIGVLHAALQPLCCLTVGDLVTVQHGGGTYDMTVLQVEPSQPSNAVMLIDTDIQVEIAPSTAEEEALLQRERDRERERAAAREQVVYV